MLKDKIKPCPFCGGIPKYGGMVVTHVTNGNNCIVSDTQFDVSLWNKRV
jgi:hypothetical protein